MSFAVMVPSRAAGWALNLWIVSALAAAIAIVVLMILCVVVMLELEHGLIEFRAVLDGIGLP